jgi:hypothetical protein
MEILNQIQADLLDPTVPLSNILRKAKVLATQLGSDELALWVSQELNGYENKSELPDYRVLYTAVAGTWTNGYWVVHNRALPLFSINDDDLQNYLSKFSVSGGIRTVEEMTKMKEGQHLWVSPEITAVVNTHVNEGGYSYAQLYYSLGPHNFEQILDTIRNRLLDFVLKLSKQWNPVRNPPAQDEISRLVSVVIYNNPQGGTVTAFDQRGQHVQYQFNAAGNINIERIQSMGELVKEIEKLRGEIDQAKKAGAVSEATAIEAQYHLLEAAREAASENPNKSTMLEKIGKAKDLLKDISSLAGLVTSLIKITEVAGKLFT